MRKWSYSFIYYLIAQAWKEYRSICKEYIRDIKYYIKGHTTSLEGCFSCKLSSVYLLYVLLNNVII